MGARQAAEDLEPQPDGYRRDRMERRHPTGGQPGPVRHRRHRESGIHRRSAALDGDHVVCYIEVGSAGNYYTAKQEGIPVTYYEQLKQAGDLGDKLKGYPEYFVNINTPSAVSIIEAMIDQQCSAKGFDGVETDLDETFHGNEGKTGFTITQADEENYLTTLADYMHGLGLAWIAKNLDDTEPRLVRRRHGAAGPGDNQRAVQPVPHLLLPAPLPGRGQMDRQPGVLLGAVAVLPVRQRRRHERHLVQPEPRRRTQPLPLSGPAPTKGPRGRWNKFGTIGSCGTMVPPTCPASLFARTTATIGERHG